MDFEGKCVGLWIFEALICASFIGISKQSWGWFFISLIGTLVLLVIPIIGGTIGIFLSLLFSMVGSVFSNQIIGWYVGVILFIVLVFLNSMISMSGHILFGFSIVIFESIILCGTINMNTEQIVLPIALFIILVALAFAPLIRLLEYIILSILTLIELYYTTAKNIPSPHTYVITFLILILMAYYFYFVYFSIDYQGIINSGKKQKFIKKINKIYPQLEKTGSEFERILNRCESENEKNSFLSDWDNYKLSLWKALKSQKEKATKKVLFSFEEWYKANERWRYTSYFHSYYNRQLNEEKYIERETERIRKLWVCDYCGRINIKDNYQCPACGAMQKIIIPKSGK